MSKLNQRTKLLISVSLMLILLIIIYISGIFISDEMINCGYLNGKQAPSLKHLFGTDALGRDLFLRTIKGLSTSITIGAIASIISAFIAIIVGMLTTLNSKKVDSIINWFIDLVMGVPHTILIILISFAFGKGVKGLLIGIALTHWCSLARLIESEVLKLRNQQYVLISKKLGKSNYWILKNHMLPHLLPQFIVGLVLMFPHAILHEASISFLGFGLPAEQAAIGIILSESMRYLSIGMWWPAVLPGLTLVFIVLLIDKIGDYLRMILDPYSAQK